MTRTRGYFTVAFVAALAALMLLLSLAGHALAQEAPTGEQPAGTTTTEDAGATTTQQTEATPLMIFFFKDGELVGVTREIPGGGQMVEFTVTDLLKGPTEEEKAQGYTSFLPEGVKMLYSTKSMTGNTYSVNLSGELMSLKETPEQAKMAMEQLVRTIKEAAQTEDINITVDIDEASRASDAFTALGINPKDLGLTGSSEEESEKSWLWLYILIVLAAILVILAILVPLYLNNRKAEASIAQEVEELEGEKSKRDNKKK